MFHVKHPMLDTTPVSVMLWDDSYPKTPESSRKTQPGNTQKYPRHQRRSRPPSPRKG